MQLNSQQQLNRLYDKRDDYRVSIRRQQKQQMLSLKRGMMEQMTDTARVMTTNTKPELEQQLTLRLQNASTEQEIVDILRTMSTFRILSSNTVCIIYQLHKKIEDSRLAEHYPKEMADLLCQILQEYLFHPDEVITEGLKFISKMVKNHNFERLFKPLAAISDWGNGKSQLSQTKNGVLHVFLTQLQDKQLPKTQQLSILEDFLRQGAINTTLCYRITNYFNGRMGLKFLSNPNTHYQSKMSILSCLKILGQTEISQANNILNCSYIIPQVLQLLGQTESTTIIKLSISFLNTLIDNQNTVRNMLHNVMLLPILSQLLERDDEKIKEKVCFFLSNLAAFSGGCQPIILYKITEKVINMYSYSSNGLRIEIAYILLNLLIMSDRQELSQLAEMSIHPIDILIDVLRQGRVPQGRWVSTKLLDLSFSCLTRLIMRQDESILSILASRNLENTLNYLATAEEKKVAEGAARVLGLLGSAETE